MIKCPIYDSFRMNDTSAKTENIIERTRIIENVDRNILRASRSSIRGKSIIPPVRFKNTHRSLFGYHTLQIVEDIGQDLRADQSNIR